MIATTQPDNGVLQRDSISLPLLRPVTKSMPPPPNVGEALTPQPPSEVPAAPSSPPTVQSIQKLNLDTLGAGDKVVVRTGNSTYNFEMGDHHACKVIPSRSTSRSGEAVLMGGTDADAAEYTPNRVFVGGRLAYQFQDEESAILTSVVESIFWVAAKRPV